MLPNSRQNPWYFPRCLLTVESEAWSRLITLSSAKLDAYSAAFAEYGYDDLELIDSMTDEERQEMFKKVGLTEKPGHLLKFTKALATRSLAVDENTGGNSNSSGTRAPQQPSIKSSSQTTRIQRSEYK